MSNFIAASNVKQAKFEGTVVRCGCTDEQKQSPDWHGLKGEVCPNPKEINNLGVIAYYSRNPLKMLAWKVKQLFK